MKRAVLFAIPLSVCNLRCHYCYLAQRPESYQGIIPDMKYSPEEIGYAMRPERLGGASYFNLCADGETLLLPRLADYVAELVRYGHFVEVVSNMTATRKLDEVLNIGRDSLNHVEFKCSFHFLELERRGLLTVFADNVNRAWEAGASINIEVTPSDELIPRIDEVKAFSMAHFGALPHVTIARDDRTEGIERLTSLDKDEHDRIWSQFDSDFFDYKVSIFGRKQNSFCYAGSWSLYANMATGMAKQCYCGSSLGDIFVNPEEPIAWQPIGSCALPHCYNGHMLLTLGDIPGATDVTYASVRDRVRADGTHWLYPELREFFGGKLEDSNVAVGPLRETMIYASGFCKNACRNSIKSIRRLLLS